MDIREKPAAGKRHVLSYEAFNNYCKECTFRMKTETYPQVVVVECSLDRCVYIRREELWEKLKEEK